MKNAAAPNKTATIASWVITLAIAFAVFRSCSSVSASVDAVSKKAAATAIASDSAALKAREQHDFMKKIDAEPLLRGVQRCQIADTDGKRMTLTMDADAYTALSDQDQTLLRKALYLEWYETYSHHHSGTPHYLTLYIQDLNGTDIASYF